MPDTMTPMDRQPRTEAGRALDRHKDDLRYTSWNGLPFIVAVEDEAAALNGPTMPDTLTLDAIRADVAKYPERYDGTRDDIGIEYARFLLARLDALTAAVRPMFLDPVTDEPTSGWYCTNEIADNIRREREPRDA